MYSMTIRWLANALFLSRTALAAAAVAICLPLISQGNAEELDTVLTIVSDSQDETPQASGAEASAPAVLPQSHSGNQNTSAASTLKLMPADSSPLQQPESLGDSPKKQTAAQEPQTKQVAAAAADPQEESLEPIPEGQAQGPAAVEAASFKGVTPGATTLEQLQEAWGSPREIRNLGREKLHLFSVGPFEQVEVVLNGNTVRSIIVHLEKPFPAGAVAKQLELGDIHPVFISNELGDVLGQAFPERGVMFAFVQNHEPGRPSMNVDKIVLEPIDAEAFVLRAETNIDSHYDKTIADLDVALKLSSDNPKAHWLRCRALAAIGNTKEAVEAGQAAVRLDGDNPQYRLELARVFAQAGRLKEAQEQAQASVLRSDPRPHIKAAAQCLLGDLAGLGEKPNFSAALEHHTAAIQTADPLSVDRHPAIRLAAKEVLIDAHLGAAADIAWGGWSQKEKAVEKWCQRAAAFAEELIANDGGTEEHRFRVVTRSLAAYVGVKGKLDPKQYAEDSMRIGEALIALADDPAKKRQLQSDLGMAMFNAMQIAQARKDNKSALAWGEKTAQYLEAAVAQGLDNPTSNYLLGRLYFRIGAIHALVQKDHSAAIAWFDKAVPLLSNPLPDDSRSEMGRHGETFVSMGVSYWSEGEKEKSLELTKVGLELMKQAVAEGLMRESSLAVPYQNLAAMQRHLGNGKAAEQFERMAENASAAASGQKTLKR